MVKSFFIYTAIIEALTGLGLLVAPALVAKVLLNADLSGSLDVILAMVAGVAICSIALLSWLARNHSADNRSLLPLLLYNIAVSLVLLYAAWSMGYRVLMIWAVIIFHLFQSVMCAFLLKEKNEGTHS